MDGIRVIRYRYGDAIPAAPLSAVALGLFDGVHLGHRALLRETVRQAKERGLTAAVFTFPSEDGVKSDSRRIYSTEQKLRLLASLGIELVYLVDFSSVRSLSDEDFVRCVLVRDMRCRLALSGYNFRFGRGAEGDSARLSSLMAEEGLGSYIMDEERVDGQAVSTTLIKSRLAEGDVAGAWRLLDSPYYISGRVRHGRGKGSEYGFPTVNTDLTDTPILQSGVYITAVPIGEKLYTGLTNVGVCPSFGARDIHAETLILDFSGDLYGMELDIYFIERIRDERTFSSPEELREQIAKDTERAISIREDLTWQAIGLR